jgi:16S rRNA (guanine527-N7)-methyltransferase
LSRVPRGIPKPPPAPTDSPGADAIFNEEASAARYAKWFPDLSDDVRGKLLTYHTELIKFNRTMNLISAVSSKQADALHFADAVLAGQLIFPALVPDAPLYDFGSGNGIPGLVIAILYPMLSLILVDRDPRKIEFCKHIAATLELKNVSFKVGTVEDLPPASVLNAAGRGFAPLSKAMIVSRKAIRKGGRFFHLKGDGWANELAQVPSQLFSYWSPSLVGQYRIPDSSIDMAVVMTEKTAV